MKKNNFCKLYTTIFIVFSISVLTNAQLINVQVVNSKPDANPGRKKIIETEIGESQSQATPFSTIISIRESTPIEIVTSNNLDTYEDIEKIAAKNQSNYLHSATNTIFPYQLEQFSRKQIIVSKNDPGKIETVYVSNDNKSELLISVLPGGEAVEGRLRNGYLKGIKELSQIKGVNYLPKPIFIRYIGKNYNCIGVQGTYINDINSVLQYNFFECGSWLISVKITSDSMTEKELMDLDTKVFQFLNPARLTGLKPLNLQPVVEFDSEEFKDTVTVGAMAGSVFKKADWATENIAANELLSGFPDIYLEMHVAALKEYLLKLGQKKSLSANPKRARFYTDLKKIYETGYLSEFLVHTYKEVLIVPDNTKLDISGYERWKTEQDIQIDLINNKSYKICYRALPY